MLGHLRVRTALLNQVATNTAASLSVAAKKITRWLPQAILISKDYTRSISIYLRRVARQLLRPGFYVGALLSGMQPRGVVAGFLIVLVLVGSLDLAMRATAVGTKPLVESFASQNESQTPSEGRVFRVSKSPEVTQAFISDAAPVPGAPSELIPLPTRKPDRIDKLPNGKVAKAKAAAKKRMAQQKQARPRPMR